MKNNKFRLFLTLFISLTISQLHAQNPAAHDSLVKLLMNRHIAINQAKNTMPGYRVQIYFGSQRTEANDVKENFTELYPDMSSYLIYHQPNFKIRVGDFKTRLEAMKFLKEIQARYATSFLVEDDVMLPK